MDASIFLETPPNHLFCPICLNVLVEPVQCSSGHAFCKVCIRSVVMGGSNVCPIGREPISLTSLQPNLIVRHIIEDYQVICSTCISPPVGVQASQCDWRGKCGDLNAHLEKCPFMTDRIEPVPVPVTAPQASFIEFAPQSSQLSEPIPAARVNITASHDCRGGGTGREYVTNLLSNGTENWNKWFTDGGMSSSAWVQQQFPVPFRIVSYTLCSANDCPRRDPTSWTLLGKPFDITTHTDSPIWVVLHRVNTADFVFSRRWESRTFCLPEEQQLFYSNVRLEIDSVREAGNGMQLGGFILNHSG